MTKGVTQDKARKVDRGKIMSQSKKRRFRSVGTDLKQEQKLHFKENNGGDQRQESYGSGTDSR